VDDEFGLAEMLRDMLRELGYDVTFNGRLAMEALGERRVDVVLSDLMVPVMDGIELATAIRNSEVHRHIPIVMMTSLPAVPEDDLFDAVLRKPFSPELLIKTLRTVLCDPENEERER
jgi:CheY-like chemotaxis protein